MQSQIPSDPFDESVYTLLIPPTPKKLYKSKFTNLVKEKERQSKSNFDNSKKIAVSKKLKTQPQPPSIMLNNSIKEKRQIDVPQKCSVTATGLYITPPKKIYSGI